MILTRAYHEFYLLLRNASNLLNDFPEMLASRLVKDGSWPIYQFAFGIVVTSIKKGVDFTNPRLQIFAQLYFTLIEAAPASMVMSTVLGAESKSGD